MRRAPGVVLLVACGGATIQSPRPELGSLEATEAPPAPTDPYFEDRPGQVWVHGRWARLNDQWVWQPGYHEPARPGMVFVHGYWDRDPKTRSYTWIREAWRPERPGQVHVPGHWDRRGNTFVWIRDRWEAARPGARWVPGTWTGTGDERTFVPGHWEDATAAPR